ncbi:MAG: hypothetical protein A2161_02460 [Candidatus Schekmanbacteria bacterium RBG_13_48_7]|uniref:Enoyl reductase (ER) domain-containing protein n=1 Tax=Candidatus Schekmanbacteria bacterium RBG_13_48_7 TaxID=1817878 RepID=A0A1F7RY06_9BACT|nr:MAG: hypothetical protein A2161_02460 [Candidatus Schekmanbacteria bacterium RBG_13_48_7]
MKTIQILRKGSPESLKIVDIPEPVLAPDEVLIKVKACGVNFADILARQGLYPDAPNFPFIPGYEVAGIIAATGKNVADFRQNDRVLAFTNFGGYAEYAVALQTTVRKINEKTEFVEAAGFPVNFCTAYHCLYQTGPFKKGFKVLIHAAAGGVGQAAIQLCKLNKCVIFGTAGSSEKLQLLKQLKVDYPINYRTEDFFVRINEIFPGQPLDIILDSIGGSYINRGLSLLKPNGRLITFGFASVSGKNWINILWTVLRMKKINPISLLAKSRGIFGVNILHIFKKNPELAHESFNNVFGLFQDGSVKPHIALVLPLEQAAEAHRLLQNRDISGKIVLINP